MFGPNKTQPVEVTVSEFPNAAAVNAWMEKHQERIMDDAEKGVTEAEMVLDVHVLFVAVENNWIIPEYVKATALDIMTEKIQAYRQTMGLPA